LIVLNVVGTAQSKLQCFDAVGWVFGPVRTISKMASADGDIKPDHTIRCL